MKLCRTCKIEKPFSEFYTRTKGSLDGYRTECKKCLGIRTSQTQKNNHEGRRAKVRKWISANGEKLKELKRGYYPKWKEYHLQKGREERRLKPHLYRARLGRRRAAKLNATPPWVDHEAINVIYARAAATGMQVDHIYPLQGKNSCGLHVPWNLQLLTAEENLQKGNRLPTPAQGAQGNEL